MLDAILRIVPLEILLQSRATFLAFFIRHGFIRVNALMKLTIFVPFCDFLFIFYSFSFCFCNFSFIVATHVGSHTFTVVVLTLIDTQF